MRLDQRFDDDAVGDLGDRPGIDAEVGRGCGAGSRQRIERISRIAFDPL